MRDFILDIGSRTIKLHGLDRSTGEVINLSNVTWDILSTLPSKEGVARSIEASVAPLSGREFQLRAVGTEAMRKNPALERMVTSACSQLEIEYTTISQELEAELISIAAQRHGIPEDYDVVNSGGGSLQIVHQTTNQIELLNVGITELNVRFNLQGVPQAREIENCVKHLETQLARRTRPIAYTGGEKTYLESFGVSLQSDGSCRYEVFEAFAREMGQQSNEWLTQRSPFDSGWMTGAIASNCIVLALMNSRESDYFLPSDLNIGHGFLSSVCNREL